jgi:hypothetical protein
MIVCAGRHARSLLIFALSAIAAACVATPPADGAIPPKLRTYETRYYTLYTDVSEDDAKEACARITAMAEEYHKRTKDFAGHITRRLPFYLISDAKDYAAMGGMGAGVFMGDRLMACAAYKGMVWHIIQHEGFHQFASMVITPRLPVWVNEGLAEYFGFSLWTGDGMVSGLIPPDSLRTVKSLIEKKQMMPFRDMLTMSHGEWNSRLDRRNYDQAWSMVQFLAHADNNRYQKPFAAFINDIAGGMSYEKSFEKNFGRDIDAFEKRYTEWWTSLPDNPTADRYDEAVVERLTCFLARACAEGQKFKDVSEFFGAARDGSLKQNPKQWLPPSLLKNSLDVAAKRSTWSLDAADKGAPHLVLSTSDGFVFTGTFTVRGAEVDRVSVDVKRPKAPEKK